MVQSTCSCKGRRFDFQNSNHILGCWELTHLCIDVGGSHIQRASNFFIMVFPGIIIKLLFESPVVCSLLTPKFCLRVCYTKGLKGLQSESYLKEGFERPLTKYLRYSELCRDMISHHKPGSPLDTKGVSTLHFQEI